MKESKLFWAVCEELEDWRRTGLHPKRIYMSRGTYEAVRHDMGVTSIDNIKGLPVCVDDEQVEALRFEI
jgi:hypothetical protein